MQVILQELPDIQIFCDADKIQRVFDNLLKNAVNYSYEGTEIVIMVEQDPRGSVTITFVNHGNTISESKLKRIFEQFYRLDTARSSKSGGAGLGLAISKQIVETHGGTIRAESADELIGIRRTMVFTDHRLNKYMNNSEGFPS